MVTSIAVALRRSGHAAALATLTAFAACAPSTTDVGTSSAPLTATCVDSSATIPPGALRCSDVRVVECTGPSGTDPGTIYVVPAPVTDGGTAPLCADTQLTIDHPQPLPLGSTTVTVTETAEAGTGRVCTSTITVRDTTPPRATSKDSTMWPPNHEMTRFAAADCVTAVDTCSAHVSLSFTYVTSDEPADSTGDGHTTADVAPVGCDAVDLRSERKGNANGRVYRLGWRAVDESGNATLGECRVSVTHDQRPGGSATGGPEAYRVTFPPCK